MVEYLQREHFPNPLFLPLSAILRLCVTQSLLNSDDWVILICQTEETFKINPIFQIFEVIGCIGT
jgi:hypothetical protein